MDGSSPVDLSFGTRLKLAWRMLFDAGWARSVLSPTSAERATPAQVSVPAAPAPALPQPAQRPTEPTLSPERKHASGLALLAALQREGRLIDFLQQDVTAFSDEDVAAAARVVHTGCQRVLRQSLELEPAVADAEGATISVPPGFDAQRLRLIGNLSGPPPYRGTVRHHGWIARAVKFPELSAALDPRVLASAEIELP